MNINENANLPTASDWDAHLADSYVDPAERADLNPDLLMSDPWDQYAPKRPYREMMDEAIDAARAAYSWQDEFEGESEVFDLAASDALSDRLSG